MRSKTAKKIFSETSEETKEKVKQKTNKIIKNRRNRLDLNVPAEKAIYYSIEDIENYVDDVIGGFNGRFPEWFNKHKKQ